MNVGRRISPACDGTMSTARIITVHGNEVSEAAVAEVVACLEGGGVVSLPTETVYGLCCRASRDEAIDRIFKLKGRPREKALPFLIPDADSIHTFVNAVPQAAAKLMRRFWPGPLTLVLGPGEGVALRLPDHPWTRAVLRASSGPVLGTSANRSGEKAATTGRRVLRYFPEGLDILVDAGKSRLGTESTIVRIPPTGPLSIVRVGQIGEETVRVAAAKTVLFVCSGNTCRSPMAASVLRHLISQALGTTADRLERAGFRIESAGISAFPGAPMPREAVLALQRQGIEPGEHQSRPVTPDLVKETDLILTMTRAHAAALESQHGIGPPLVSLLAPDGEDIPDPIGGGDSIYEECLSEIRRAVETRLPRILDRSGG